MLLINETQIPKIEAACKSVELFLNEYLGIIKQEPYFTHTKMSPTDVYYRIKLGLAQEPSFTIRLYRSRLPWSKAIAYTTKDSRIIFLNSRMLDFRDKADYANTICHEMIHSSVLGGFTHGSNNPRGKERSVNYRVGQIVEDFTRRTAYHDPSTL